MKNCLLPEGRVWLSYNEDPKRKLRYTWEIAELEHAKVFLYPAKANLLVREAIEDTVISELQGYTEIVTEARVGEHSRIDLLLRDGQRQHYVEVKSATLGLGGGRTSFPDAVSTRASKHLRELVELKRQGHKATLMFCASRTDATAVEPADDIDPEYGDTLRWASSEGVQILAYGVVVDVASTHPEVRLHSRLEVRLHKPSGPFTTALPRNRATRKPK